MARIPITQWQGTVPVRDRDKAARIDVQDLIAKFGLDPDLEPVIRRFIHWLMEGCPLDQPTRA